MPSGSSCTSWIPGCGCHSIPSVTSEGEETYAHAGEHEARARLAHAARLAAPSRLILVVAVGAAAHGVVGLHARRRHALEPHALGARLARLGRAHHVGERHA
uniref:Alternative protein LOC100288866 n=1 Tax=Homo sapiens TaxID=9606 RepID=L0R501_HUMAN|nr:alternative protein LOC100288866 [Homo sapiens]